MFVDTTHQARKTWYGASGKAFHSGMHRLLGGNSKVHGAAMFRLRERDFDEKRHKDGIPPAWPLKRIYYNSDSVMLDLGKVTSRLRNGSRGSWKGCWPWSARTPCR